MSKSISLNFIKEVIEQLKKQNKLLKKIKKSMILNGQVDLTKDLDNHLAKDISLDLLNEIEDSLNQNSYEAAELKIDDRSKLYLIKDIRSKLDLKMESRISVLYNHKFLFIFRQVNDK